MVSDVCVIYIRICIICYTPLHVFSAGFRPDARLIERFHDSYPITAPIPIDIYNTYVHIPTHTLYYGIPMYNVAWVSRLGLRRPIFSCTR